MHYILIGHKAVPANLMTWARWYEATSRLHETRVAETTIGATRVSTIFLGLDHQWGDGPPLLFETMTFGGPTDQRICQRCSTWSEAEAQHAEVCDQVRGFPAQWQARHVHERTKP